MTTGINRANDLLPITSRIAQPTPEDIKVARLHAGLTQTQAAQLVSTAQGQPYRTWQAYEVEGGKSGHRAIPLATWELFLLLIDRHPTHRLVRRRVGRVTAKSVPRKKEKRT